ncbi:MAG: tetratricopeptide repeat protein [Akkermansiaceae bacterium]
MPTFILSLVLALGSFATAALSTLQQIDVKTFEKMREVERYQIKIAEKHFLKGSFKIALAEYEKFLTLYEKSVGAPYAQLMWSHTMMKLKKPKTALREGFQSVIDYWPESPEATIASYCMGDAYRTMGEIKDAQKSYRFLIKEYPSHELAMRARQDLLHYARLHEDMEERLTLLSELTFRIERTEKSKAACIKACHELAELHCFAQNLDQGKKALATTYSGTKLFEQVYSLSVKTMKHLLGDQKTRIAALKLGDQLIMTLRNEATVRTELASQFFYQAADLNTTLGRHSETMKIYREIGERFGMNDSLRGTMAKWYKSRDRRNEARKIYGEFEDQLAGLKNLATMSLEEKKVAGAITIYRQLIKIDDNNSVEYLLNIASCYESQPDWEKAIACYREIIEIDKDNSVKYLLTIAGCYKTQSDWQKAIACYREIIEIDGDNSGEYLWSIAGCYETQSDWKKAIACYRQIDRFPANYFAMANCHRKIEEHREAITLYNQIKILEKSAPEASLQIGYTYEEAKDKEKAIRTFQLTCKRYPKSGQASKAHSHLQNKYQINVTLGGTEEE